MGVCAPYLQVGVAAVMEWDTPTRERVLFEGLVLTSKTDGENTTLCCHDTECCSDGVYKWTPLYSGQNFVPNVRSCHRLCTCIDRTSFPIILCVYIASESHCLYCIRKFAFVRLMLSPCKLWQNVHGSSGLEARKMESKEHVFQYHVSRSDVTSSLRFIMSSIPPLENHTPCSAHIVELCSKIPHPTQYLKTCLRNELAR